MPCVFTTKYPPVPTPTTAIAARASLSQILKIMTLVYYKFLRDFVNISKCVPTRTASAPSLISLTVLILLA